MNHTWIAGKSLNRHLLLILLVIVILPSLGFTRANSSAFQQESYKSVSWGFECFNFWKIPQYQNSYPTAQNASKILGQHGYEIDLQKNPTQLSVIQSSFRDAEVFFFAGHGAPQGLVLTDKECNPKFVISRDYLTKNREDGQRLRFVLLAACETGQGENNILESFVNIGATKAIGFNKRVHLLAIQYWSDRFWKYALRDKMEVSDAAYRATKDIEILGDFTGINSSSLEIIGTSPVYLGYEHELLDLDQISDEFSEWWNNVPDNIQQLISDIGENIKDYWEEQTSKIQKSIEEWLQQQVSNILDQLLKSIENLIFQLCFQPFASILVFTGVFLYQKRHSR